MPHRIAMPRSLRGPGHRPFRCCPVPSGPALSTQRARPPRAPPRPARRPADTALGRLEEAIDVLATEPLTSSLYSGFTGIAWAAETTDRLLGTQGIPDRNGDIDEALTSLLRRYPEHAPYDLIHGLAGIGVYALARWPRPG